LRRACGAPRRFQRIGGRLSGHFVEELTHLSVLALLRRCYPSTRYDKPGGE
jgi:hypothetical protein